MGAERLDHGRQPTSPTRKEKGRPSRRPQSCSFSRQEGARERRMNGSRTALRGAVSGRLVFNETARPASRALCRRAALACGHRSHAAPGLGHDPQPVGDLCERKSRRRFASSCAGSRIAFHSASSRLGPGCVTGFRESAVEGFAPIPPRLSRAHAAQAECDPGSSARLCREAAPNHGGPGRPELRSGSSGPATPPFDISQRPST